MKVTREMIVAAHDICLKKGDFVLSADLLERIYLAMDALANRAETSGSSIKQQSSEDAKDAARYRWLRKCMPFSIAQNLTLRRDFKNDTVSEELDAAIDAAMEVNHAKP